MAINYLSSINLNRNELQDAQLIRAQVENQPNDAAVNSGATPVTGQIYYNTTDSELRQYNGTAWVSVGDITSLTQGTNINITDPSGPSPTINLVDNPTLAGNLTITKNSPILEINDTVANDCQLQIKQSGSTTAFISRGGTSSTGQFNFRTTNGSTTTNALFINQQARATFAGDVVIDGGDITLGGTGRIQGVDTVTDNTDAANKLYVDNAIAGVPQGTLTGLGQGTYITIDTSTPAVPIINASGTATPYVAATDDSKLVARDANGYAYVKKAPSGDNSTKIATTSFVQAAVTGLLEFKGGFNANTGDLDSPLTTDLYTDTVIEVGDYYVVTTAGDFFGNTATPLTVGDSVIAQKAVPDPSTTPAVEADFVVVQSDTDLATLTTVGIGNVNEGSGINVSYSNGTATVSGENSTATNKGIVIVGGSDPIEVSYAGGTATVGIKDSAAAQKGAVIVDAGTGISVAYVSGTATVANTDTNFSNTDEGAISSGSLSGTVTHNWGTEKVIVQTYKDNSTDNYPTVFCDITRTSNTVTATIASTETDDIVILVQKIG